MAEISDEAAAELEEFIKEGTKRSERYENTISNLKEELRQFKFKRHSALLEEEAQYRAEQEQAHLKRKAASLNGPLTDPMYWTDDTAALQAHFKRIEELKAIGTVSAFSEEELQQRREKQAAYKKQQAKDQRDTDQLISTINNPINAVLYDLKKWLGG